MENVESTGRSPLIAKEQYQGRGFESFPRYAFPMSTILLHSGSLEPT